MANAWGVSWGVAWGVSWGGGTPTPTPSQQTGGGFWINRSKKHRKKPDQEYLADRIVLREEIETAMGLKAPAVQGLVAEIKEVVAPYIETRAAGPKLDISALWNITEDLAYVRNLLVILQKELDENDEDEVFLLM